MKTLLSFSDDQWVQRVYLKAGSFRGRDEVGRELPLLKPALYMRHLIHLKTILESFHAKECSERLGNLFRLTELEHAVVRY